MAVDPSVLAAIRAAVDADGGNVELRSHFAGLLLEDGQFDAAFAEATYVLASRPDHLPALSVAARSGMDAGEPDRAAAYARLLAALSADQGPGAPPMAPPEAARPDLSHLPPPPSAAVPTGGPDIPDTADELLKSWAASQPISEPEIGQLHRPSLTLADVGGLQNVKDRLEQSFLGPMRNPELRLQFGKSLRGGLLLWGPPGCGKTYLARAVAGELGANFYEVGIADVLDMWIGSSERNLRSVFEVARGHRPCVLFFDEIDALGHKRTQLRNGGSGMRNVVNQLLTELDGVSSDNEGVFVLAATNHPWDLDPALVRPGRFDRKLVVLPPDEPARLAILETHLRGKPLAAPDLRRIARATDGFTGADLALLCEQATETALAASMQSGTVHPIADADLDAALRTITPSTGGWFETAGNFATYANETGEYDELIAYLKRRRRR